MIRQRSRTAILALGALLAGGALAWSFSDQPSAAAREADVLVLAEQLRSHPGIRSALVDQLNSGGFSTFERAQRERVWRAERAQRAGTDTPLIDSIMASPLSRQLQALALLSPQVEQIMVMDAYGQLVAAVQPSTDYDQSDEPKWQQTFLQGRADILIEGVEEMASGDRVIQLAGTVQDSSGGSLGAVMVRVRLR